jgi:hypothetical protein
MSINCRSGGTSHQHETVAEVKACWGQGSAVKTEGFVPPTERQVKFFNGLCDRQGLRLTGDRKAEEIAKREISRLISVLVARKPAETPPAGLEYGPAKNRETEAPLPDVPSGYYAVDSLTGNNDLDFFSIEKKTEGRWAGRTFVNRVIGGRSETSVRGKTVREALEAIEAAGPAKASARYGQEIGRCGKCNRTLTDELSRSLGIGPVCRSL